MEFEKQINERASLKKETINLENNAKKIAQTFGTPAFVVYEKTLKKNYERFYNSFKENYDNIMVPYSVKTNYLPAILSILHSMGAGMEVVSGFELYLALKLGVPPQKIIYNGPAKSMDELEFALGKGILIINADSKSELEKIDKIGNKYGKRIDTGIRVSIKTITWQKFGIPSDFAEDAFRFASKLKNINVRGLHVHIGSGLAGIPDTRRYILSLEHMLELVKKLRQIGITIDILDIGGGFPAGGIGKWPTRDRIINALSNRLKKSRLRFPAKFLHLLKSEKPLFPNPPAIETYASEICSLLNTKLDELGLPKPMLILEPGRAIVNTAVRLLVKAMDVKNYQTKMVMVDGGINLAPSFEHSAYRLTNATGQGSNFETVTVAGPLCTEYDILSRRVDLLPVSEGDIIEVLDVGAYSICRSMQFIRPRANAVLVRENGEILEVRRREQYEDLIALDEPFFKSL